MNQQDRLATVFANKGKRAALIPYVTAGDPSPQATVPLMHALVEAGADVIELGVPFSDPMADGPVVQRATQRAIEKGVGLVHVLHMVQEFRRTNAVTPVVLMGYANPIERFGQEVFAQKAAEAGVDGVLVVDYPPEEMIDFARYLEAAAVAPIFLLAPTSTEDRVKKVAKIARGYVYYVSLKGVTGSGNLDITDVEQRLAAIRQHLDIPLGVGFGIRDAESARRLGQVSDAVIIGSKLIETMEEAVAGASASGQDADMAAVQAAKAWLGGIRQALN
ncbi:MULTISPECIES: tryptophan synthase subunit alpha [unclassified Pusillimonas]|uniref:tryptophan synthase subunit alpha n=1 Tax=unclassified Pusillimonas TaxID=2640016 RepID=UPI000B9D083F|nr:MULTISPECIES: tryptophan synthase subunit alpha [unclassified Pusillimonas]OXR50396.1 tryptophan synthase subunit alpha [Pusillimonas sp. T2]ROT44634.1 tryptophan synthase subunit alpha [Pusillimonas sp. NJUB218]